MRAFFISKIIKRALIVLVLVCAGAVAGYFATSLNSLPRVQTRKQAAAVLMAQQINVEPKTFYPVTDVVDGDTFKVKIDGKEITVRLLGINTPEVVDPRKPVECFGPEASAETKSLLTGRKVKLALNPRREKTDKYGRLLAFAYRDDGLFVNEFLVKQGFAREYTVGSPYQFQNEFRQAQMAAKVGHAGLWGICN